MNTLQHWFKDQVAAGKSRPSTSDEYLARQCICQREDCLYVVHGNSLYCFTGFESCGENDLRYQQVVKLRLSIPINFSVTSIRLNAGGKFLAVLGKRQLLVVQLPAELSFRSTSRTQLEQSYLCRSFYVGSSLFCKGYALELLVAKWHPGSSIATHIVILTSDCVLRIYDITSPELALLSVVAGEAELFNERSRMMKTSLGEAAVSFEFGDCGTDLKWPIFILHGNADIYYVESSADTSWVSELRGPLHVRPTLDDDYGVGCCDLAYISGPVPVLVVATTYGMLYHLIVVYDQQECTFKLHAYESVGLELTLSTMDPVTREVHEDDYGCPLYLFHDRSAPTTYYCYHSVGVHGICLPWMHTVWEQEATSDDACRVEHIVCTKPLSTTTDGLRVVTGICSIRCTTARVLLLILSDGTVLALDHGFVLAVSGPEANAAAEPQEASVSLPPKKHQHHEYFIDQVKRMLQRSATQPLVKSGNRNLSKEDELQLMARATQVLRSEYVHKLEAAHEECDARVKLLQHMKDEEASPRLLQFQQRLAALTQRNASLVQQFKRLCKQQHLLDERLAKSTEVQLKSMDALSIAEESLLLELKQLQLACDELSSRTAQTSFNGDAGSINENGDGQGKVTSASELRLKDLLHAQGAQVEILLRSVQSLIERQGL